MDNQQETRIAWICGLLDGEGTVGVYIRDRKSDNSGNVSYSIKPTVRMTNCDKDIIDRYIENLEYFEIPYHVTNSKAKGRNAESWTVSTEGLKRVLKILPLIADGLTGRKKNNAHDLVEYCNSRLGDWHAAPFTKHQLMLVERIYERNNGKRRVIPRDYTRSSRSSKHPC